MTLGVRRCQHSWLAPNGSTQRCPHEAQSICGMTTEDWAGATYWAALCEHHVQMGKLAGNPVVLVGYGLLDYVMRGPGFHPLYLLDVTAPEGQQKRPWSHESLTEYVAALRVQRSLVPEADQAEAEAEARLQRAGFPSSPARSRRTY